MIRLKTMLLALLALPMIASAQQTEILGEGFDRESPEKIEQARQEIEALFKDAIYPMGMNAFRKSVTLANYQHLDPNGEVPTDLLEDAVIFLDANKSKFPNQNYIIVIDFKPRSDRYRFFLIDMVSGAVEKFHTTHGHGSDQNRDGYAERFLNIVNSGASSIGFIRTSEVYWGKFKRSVRLDGLSSTNSRVRERAIVLHGWDNAHERNIIQGLSWGCPALDWDVKDAVIDKVRDGSLMYIGVSAL